MHVRMWLFGPLKEIAPVAGERRELPDGETVAGLLAVLHREGTLPEKLLLAAAVAVNQEYAQPTRILLDGDEVAILPPVSGGCS